MKIWISAPSTSIAARATAHGEPSTRAVTPTGSNADAMLKIAALCGEYGHTYATGSWWPDEDELRRRGIAVVRFVQRPGELVYVGIGTLHWVRAEGATVNIAWNVGPATVRQFQAAVRRYQLNRERQAKSIVPLQTLAWSLLTAGLVSGGNASLVDSVREFCRSSLREERQAADMCLQHNIVNRQRTVNLFCASCLGELFNHVFTSRKKDYCGRCVELLKLHQSVTVTLGRPLGELEELFASC